MRLYQTSSRDIGREVVRKLSSQIRVETMDARTAWEFDVSRCDVCASMHETRGGMFWAEERNVQGRSRITGDSGRVIVRDCVVA